MSDVFVSYKAEDKRRVRPIVDALKAEGFSVWWDEQIGGGAAWRQAIEAQLVAAKCVIVVWSKRSTRPEGAFVHDEASRAMELGTYLPIKIDNCRPPPAARRSASARPKRYPYKAGREIHRTAASTLCLTACEQ